MRRNGVRLVSLAATAGMVTMSLAACGGGGSTTAAGGSNSSASGGWATAQSAQAGGGMDALVAAAKQEGALNVIALPPTWADYGEVISTFESKYGIKVSSANPNGSSGDEMNALSSTKGQSTAPDVVDIGNSYAQSGARSAAFAPYKVATWADIPDGQKDEGGLWYSDMGGYVSIGCNAAKVGGTCPKSFKDLLNPEYQGKVAFSGDPTNSNSAFEAVWAAALANGGSADNIAPGIDFFKKLNDEGIFNKTKATPANIASGATPIVLDWDYLNISQAAELAKSGITWTTSIPTDGVVSAYYAQAINVNAPHPAAARLWEEYLYSQTPDGGQNLWLKGSARPIELATMLKNGSAVGADKLPAVKDVEPFLPNQDQITKAKSLVTQSWANAVK